MLGEVNTFSLRPEAIEFYDDFAHSNTLKKYVLGTNTLAIAVSESYSIDGFIDERCAGQKVNDYPVLRIEEIETNALVISALTGVLPVTFKKRLDERKIRNINYIEFLKVSAQELPPVWYLGECEKDLKQNFISYQKVYALLQDESSRDTFKKLIQFKVSGNLEFMLDFSDRQNQQYFDHVLDLGEGETFVDVGGFDGFTSLEFARRYPGYEAIHFFEPDLRNLNNAKINLSSLKNVSYYQCGLSDQNATLRFFSDGSSSCVSASGALEITVDKLDSLLSVPYTFLKMDIEGAEGAAIEGAKRSIYKHHPKLAISVYHKVDDFWKIPLQVLAIREDYDIFMRHYTEGFTETVMFFIPKN